jgi:NADH-quinone oxidoreductase subunit L
VLDVIWLIPAFPLLGFIINLVAGRRLGEPKSGYLATSMVLLSFLTTAAVFITMLGKSAEERQHMHTFFEWLGVGGLNVKLALLADPLSITMCLFVTGIGSLIHLYAIGYMHGDEKFSKFFLYLNLFVLSMLTLVLGENMLVTFLGWEGVGVCSYFLISFWHTRNSAAVAGKKAFVTNRIGDWGFMMAMFFTFQAVGSLSYSTLNKAAEATGGSDFSGGVAKSTFVAIAVFLFVGACGKSAQLPLYVWLPDAMEGPTPVSALIHAATMVTAGVYLCVRVNPLLSIVPDVGTVIAIVGAATALFAATVAVAQNDIKKVLAYSTVSQLGYMFLAVGSGAYVAAIFHMVTHAFFKALLFMGSGSVIHGMHDEQDMRFMGALRKVMPITGGTFIVGWLAIAGFPGLSGFFSKDEILLYAYDKSPILWFVGIVTAVLTAYYMTRQVMMVFFGEARWNDPRDHALGHDTRAVAEEADADEGPLSRPARAAETGQHDAHAHHEVVPHESPWTMWVPLVVLAGLSLVGGVLQLPFSKDLHFLEHWLSPVTEFGEHKLSDGAHDLLYVLMAVAIAGALIGMATGVAIYNRGKGRKIEPKILANAWYVDATYAKVVGGPGTALFNAITDVDRVGVDGAVNGVGSVVRAVSGQVRRLQTGFVRTYVWGISVGAVAILTWFVVQGAR